MRLVLPPPTSVSSVHAPCSAACRRERLLDGEEDQPALLGLVDDLELDAGAALDRGPGTHRTFRASRTALVATARTRVTA